jgi:hypothetical protein
MNRIVLAVALLATGAVAHADGKTKTFIDVHHLPKNLTDEQLAADHKKDLDAEKKHKGVKYTRYWYEKDTGTLMCECQSPSKEECEAVHKEAHDGHAADEIHEMVEHH